jgi:hypothetical protein
VLLCHVPLVIPAGLFFQLPLSLHPPRCTCLPAPDAGSLLSEAVPVLVLPDSQAEAAAELCQLQQLESEQQQQQQQQQLALQEGKQQAAPAASAADVVRLVAAVLCYLQQRQEAEAAGPHTAAASTFEAAYPPTAIARLALAARWLVALAVRTCWPAVARLMLPGVTADGSSTAAAERPQRPCPWPGPPGCGLWLCRQPGSAAQLGWCGGRGVGPGASWRHPASGQCGASAGPAAGGGSHGQQPQCGHGGAAGRWVGTGMCGVVLRLHSFALGCWASCARLPACRRGYCLASP